MSGTSMDGIDAAVVEIDGDERGMPGACASSWAAQRAVPARRAPDPAWPSTTAAPPLLCRLHAELGEWFAEAAGAGLAARAWLPRQVDLVGSHGQTVWHEPPARCGWGRGATLQLGCPATWPSAPVCRW